MLKKKSALMIATGTAIGLVAGGATAWWLIRQHTPISELPIGADVLPENTAISLSVSTDPGQWRRLRQYGNNPAQGLFDSQLITWRDRLFYENGLDYSQQIQPWVGEEITVAFLNPFVSEESEEAEAQEILPYQLPNTAESDRSAVMIMPIANPSRAESFWSQPMVREGQDWANRDYKGIQIREVHGQERLDYALAKLDDRFLIASGDTRLVEQVIDTFRGETAVARNTDYGRAFSQLRETVSNPFLRMYINIPAARELTAINPNQPIPPQLLSLLQNNQGLASAMTLESDGLRFRGVSWLAPNSRTRLKVANEADRMPILLPQETVFMTSGDNFQQFWQTYSQSAQEAEQVSQVALQNPLFSPDTIYRTFNNLTGLNWEQDIIPWTSGEFALSLLSAPATDAASTPTSGLLFLLQVSDRRGAESAFEQLDQAMRERNGWQVQETEVEGQPVIRWTSPFGSLGLTRGWLDGDVVFLALGTGTNSSVAEAMLPTPTTSLMDNDLFRTATTTDLRPNSGHFFLAIDALMNPDISLPVPIFSSPNQQRLRAVQAIGLTTAVQDHRTTRHDARIVLPRTHTSPATLPPPGVTNSQLETDPEAESEATEEAVD